MTNLRFKAFETASSRKPVKVEMPKEKTSAYYGSMTFSRTTMQEYLPKDIYQILVNAIENGEKIDRKIADSVATALKAWAISKGATHYTHWFQPLTGETAEKHDAFFSSVENGRAIESFQGNQLVQQEPDASSFPSGGIRNTFEARGYTAWDPSSPAFIIDDTLCIPSIFVSYTGESLDYKTPLLKSISALNDSSVSICKFLDMHNITKVKSVLGVEQEYFLIDAALYNARPDLVLTGRTLLGHASAKDQQLEDNYFGAIPERVLNFMKDFEIEAYKLGIPLKTRHNEVAPNQFECAPIFEEANLANDHNQLLMNLIERIALHHNFVAVLHEKPFAGVNGSGKHNNWSIMTNTGINLLSPGNTPESNLSFLTFLVNIIAAVNEHAELLRASIASASNDLRLGANEAPPAIISVFAGNELSNVLDILEKGETKKNPKRNGDSEISLNIPIIPEILMDNTDRNRTSPFAFTGNKFEFRAVGSSANCAQPLAILNTIVAYQLKKFQAEVEKLLGKNVKKKDAILQVLRKYITESKKVRFEGNNYSEEWVKEAAKRGLANIRNTPAALKAFLKKDSVRLFTDFKIFTEREIHARYEIQVENYTKKVQIESRLIGDLSINHVIPTAMIYQNRLISNVQGLKQILDDKTYKLVSVSTIRTITDISEHISGIQKGVDDMIEERRRANRIHEADEQAKAYNEKVLPFIAIIRDHVDKLELLVDDELWTLPKYRELLFTN